MSGGGHGVHGVLLIGGGAHGAYGLGVMKALLAGASPATGHRPLDPALFAGASAGAYNAAFMVAGSGGDPWTTLNDLERLWLDCVAADPERGGNGVYRLRCNPLDLLPWQAGTPLDGLRRLAGDLRLTAAGWLDRLGGLLQSPAGGRRLLDLFDLSAFIDAEPLAGLVRRTIDLERIRGSARELRILVTDWRSGAGATFTNRDMNDGVGHQAILASAAIPGVFPPVEIHGTPYVDGSILQDRLLQPAVVAGVDVLHVVAVDPCADAVPIGRSPSTLETLDRLMILSMSRALARDLERAKGSGLTVHLYRPRRDLGGLPGILDFSRRRIEELIAMGYDDAVRHDCSRE